ncbi:hypothetical protein QBC39DRAFT_269818, partial [Podospora conica]
EVKAEFKSLRADVIGFRADITSLRADVDKLRRDIEAYNRNTTLRNLTLFIRAVPTSRAEFARGVTYPYPALFPRYADQFYGLREPRTAYQRRILDYLVQFYNIT